MKYALPALGLAAALAWGWAFLTPSEPAATPGTAAAKDARLEALEAARGTRKGKGRLTLTDENNEEFIQHFRKCAAGDDAACAKIGRQPGGKGKAKGLGEAPDSGKFGARALPRPKSRAAGEGPGDAPAPLDESMLRVALVMAAVEGNCGGGDKKACGRLRENDQEGRKLLTKMRLNLKTACDRRQFDACLSRADLELAARKLDGSAGWYDKSKKLATNVKSRCGTKHEKRADLCARADAALGRIKGKEAELKGLREAGTRR
jgi:hypothetical protein